MFLSPTIRSDSKKLPSAMCLEGAKHRQHESSGKLVGEQRHREHTAAPFNITVTKLQQSSQVPLAHRSRTLLWVDDIAAPTRYLIDTGSEISVIPPTAREKLNPALTAYDLIAANKSPIAMYETRNKQVMNVPKEMFVWPFIMADVQYPILGVEFLATHDILINTRDRELLLRPTNTQITTRDCKNDIPTVTHITQTSTFDDIL